MSITVIIIGITTIIIIITVVAIIITMVSVMVFFMVSFMVPHLRCLGASAARV